MAAKIIVACGSGIATSQTVANKVSKLLKDRGIDADVEAVDIHSLKHYIKSADAYNAVVKVDEITVSPSSTALPSSPAWARTRSSRSSSPPSRTFDPPEPVHVGRASTLVGALRMPIHHLVRKASVRTRRGHRRLAWASPLRATIAAVSAGMSPYPPKAPVACFGP